MILIQLTYIKRENVVLKNQIDKIKQEIDKLRNNN